MLSLGLLLGIVVPVRAEPYRHVLTGPAAGSADAWKIASREITPDCPSPWSVRRIFLHGGKQEGVEILEVDNGKLRMQVIPTRGMGILSVTLGDVRLGWNSPVKEVVHPQWINLQSRGGLGWLDGFSEFVCRCGLENNGHPGTDKFINNTGDEATMELTLHGKIANLPAQDVEVIVAREVPYRISVRGRVHERMFLGPKLELQTEISTEAGSAEFRVHDVITNRGGQPQEFQILYHANYGKPLLDEGTEFVAPVQRVTPFNDHAAKSVRNYHKYAGPAAGFVEQVYCLHPYGDSQGRTSILLRNQARAQAVSMSYALKDLPYLTLWKNTTAEADGYVTGLEPGTNFPYNRRIERQFGRVPKLAAGASHEATIDFAIHRGVEEVRAKAERIAAIQGERRTTVDDKPTSK